MSKRERKRLRRWAVRTERIRYGWYSEKMATAFGYCLYLKPDGSQVRLTTVGHKGRSGTAWPDVRAVGKVVGVSFGGFIKRIGSAIGYMHIPYS